MATDDEIVWLLLGLGGLAMLGGPDWGTERWFWPMPDLITAGGVRYPATVTQEFRRGSHPGVDVMYQRKGREDALMGRKFPPGEKANDGITTIATAAFFAPVDTPILAARPGKVWSVLPSVNGIFVVIDHGAPWATLYGHLSSARVKKGDTVDSGQTIGVIGAGLNKDPARGLVDSQHLRHLHFEAWYKGAGSDAAQDVAAVISTWGRSSWQTKL